MFTSSTADRSDALATPAKRVRCVPVRASRPEVTKAQAGFNLRRASTAMRFARALALRSVAAEILGAIGTCPRMLLKFEAAIKVELPAGMALWARTIA